MAEYHASLSWKRKTPEFTYDTYDRTHEITFPGGTVMHASAAPEYRGQASLVNPEEQLVSALSSCHMLTFLALAAKHRLIVDAYEDSAVGVLEKTEAAGKLWLSRVTLSPRVRFGSGTEPDAEKYRTLHERAHSECFIANSVRTQITLTL